MDLVPTHVVPNTNRSLEGDGTILLVCVCSPGEDGGILGIFLSIQVTLIWNFCFFGVLLFLKVTDSSMKKIVK